MNIERLEMESLVALKNKDTFRRNVISQMIAQIKRAAIDKGCRDNITEDFYNMGYLKRVYDYYTLIRLCFQGYFENIPHNTSFFDEFFFL